MTIYEEMEKAANADPHDIIEVQAGNYSNLINIWRVSNDLVDQIQDDLFEESLETIEVLMDMVYTMASWCGYVKDLAVE